MLTEGVARNSLFLAIVVIKRELFELGTPKFLDAFALIIEVLSQKLVVSNLAELWPLEMLRLRDSGT